jgi:hypothetical protein
VYVPTQRLYRQYVHVLGINLRIFVPEGRFQQLEMEALEAMVGYIDVDYHREARAVDFTLYVHTKSS